MARPAPAPIPYVLPAAEHAAIIIERAICRPVVRLGDASIRDLIDLYSDGTPVWLTGSTVWLPAVFKQDPPPDTDFDVIFSTQAACDRFVKGVLAEMDRRIPGFTFTRGHSGFGAARIIPPKSPEPIRRDRNLFSRISEAGSQKSDGIIDAWACNPGESVAEILMGYKHDYQRCAYLMNRAVAGNGGALTRIVRPVTKASMDSRYIVRPVTKASMDSRY